MNVSSPAALGLIGFILKSKHDGTEFVIHAKNENQAWNKFCTQKFGALKPSRDDWEIKTPA